MCCVQPPAKRVGIWKCQHRQCYMKHAPSLSLVFVYTCVSLPVRKPTQTFFLQSADLWNLNNLACSCALFQSRLRHHHEIQFGPWCASLQHKNSSTTAWRCANFQWRGLRCCLLTNGTTVTKILHPLSWRKTRPEQFAHGFMQQEHASKEQKTRKRQTKFTKAPNCSKTQNDRGCSDSIHWSMCLVIRSQHSSRLWHQQPQRWELNTNDAVMMLPNRVNVPDAFDRLMRSLACSDAKGYGYKKT